MTPGASDEERSRAESERITRCPLDDKSRHDSLSLSLSLLDSPRDN